MDRRFVEQLIRSSYENGAALSDLTEEVITLSVAFHLERDVADHQGNISTDSCPACGADVGFGTGDMATCGNGHEWCMSSTPFFTASLI